MREHALQVLVTLAALQLATAAGAAVGDDRNRDELDTDDPAAALAVSQAALGNELPALTLTHSDGEPFPLARLRGRPAVVSLIYTSCHHVCPVITRHLASAVEIGREALGEDAFGVVTIGFDWRVDTPDRMRMFAATNGINEPGWYFLSGDEESITTLSNALGFRFSPSSKGFDHLSQTTVVDRDGRVYRQVYGAAIEPPALVEPLKELVFDTPSDAGPIEHWVDTFRLFCTVFDPRLGRYRFDYSILMTAITGLLCLGAVGIFIVREWRRPR